MIDDKDKISVLEGLVSQGIQTERKLRAEIDRLRADNADLLAALRDVSSMEGTEGMTDAHFVEQALVIINAAIAKVSK